MKPETITARGGRDVESASRPLTPPIYQSSVWVFGEMETVDAVWDGQRPGFVYGRFGTPNSAMLEQMLAALEGAEAAVACASGMGALTAVCAALLAPGDHLVAARDLYGSTAALLAQEGRRLGIETTFVDERAAGQILSAVRATTRAVYVEAMSNPLLRLVDFGAIAGPLATRGVPLLVDASLASPAVLRPLDHGAQLVIHSATKFLSGHGDVTAGVVAGPRELIERVRACAVRIGSNLGPFDAWLAARGLRTLHVRLDRQCANALAVARWLEGHPGVTRVHYPGLDSHPQRALAKGLFPGRAGAMVSFELAGGAAAVESMMRRLRLIEFAPSFGDLATTWSYPVRTSHRGLPEAERRTSEITDGLVRLSVGIEAEDDLIEDLRQALEAQNPRVV
jgi:cystathionine beta-lyase/cystathionine gamma-synthase